MSKVLTSRCAIFHRKALFYSQLPVLPVVLRQASSNGITSSRLTTTNNRLSSSCTMVTYHPCHHSVARVLKHMSSTRRKRILVGSRALPVSIVSNNAGESTNIQSRNFSSDENSSNDIKVVEKGLFRLLTTEQRKLLDEQRNLQQLTRGLVTRVGIRPKDAAGAGVGGLSFLERLELEAHFSVVVCGEFNAGKSTLLNALLGDKLLESGSLPTTDAITIVTKGDTTTTTTHVEKSSTEDSSTPLGVDIRRIDSSTQTQTDDSNNNDNNNQISYDWLEDLTLIDTPGTNSAWLDHTAQTLRLLPEADLIFFVTSADRPFSESERLLLTKIQHYRKDIVVLVNKMDILETTGGDHGQQAKAATVDFVTDHASELLGARPIVIPISSRDALSAKVMQQQKQHQDSSYQDSNLWKRSNFEALESFLKQTLTTESKLRSKLVSPLGVVEGSLTQALTILKEENEALETDIATLNLLNSQFDGWKKELDMDLQAFRRNITEAVQGEGQRVAILLDTKMSFTTFSMWWTSPILQNASNFSQEWTRAGRKLPNRGYLQGSTDKESGDSLVTGLLEVVSETADSIATRGRAQGQAVIEYLGKRPSTHNQSLVGSITAASRFEDTRKNLEERMTRAVRDSIETSNEESDDNDDVDEALLVFAELRKMMFACTILQVGALSSGGAIMLEVVTPMVGGSSATALAAASIGVYSLGTFRLQKKYQQSWSERATELDQALEGICFNEVEKINRRILDGVAPYTRYVEQEEGRITELREVSEGLLTETRRLRNRMKKLFSH